jgi:hypothetical protein
MLAALHCADGNRVGDEPRLRPGFDDEQAPDLAKHGIH